MTGTALGPCVVLKFGGAAVSSTAQFARITHIIAMRKQVFERVVVVVSAMGTTTDTLISLAHEVHPHPPERELDMLISTGERVSMALLSMAMQARGLAAQSFTGSQAGVVTTDHHTQARIVDMRPGRILTALSQGAVAIVAGFQGVSRRGEITTLGRGGSDTSAVALGVALGAQRVEFYKDVPGVFSDDPKKNPEAHLLPLLTFAEALNIVTSKKSKILQDRSIKLAQKNNLELHVLPFNQVNDAHLHCKTAPAFGTIIGTPGSPDPNALSAAPSREDATHQPQGSGLYEHEEP